MPSRKLLVDESAGIAEECRRYLIGRAIRRDRALIEELRDLYLVAPEEFEIQAQAKWLLPGCLPLDSPSSP